MKRNIFLSIFFLLFTPSLYSQIDIVAGPILNHDKGVHLYKIIGKSDDAVFSLWIDSRGKGGNDEFYLERHNLKTLVSEYSVQVFFPDERGKYAIMEDAYLLNDKIVFLTSMQKPNFNILYAQTIDFNGKVILPAFHLDSISNGGFNTSYSKKANTIIIHKEALDKDVYSNKLSIYNATDFTNIIYDELKSGVNLVDSYNYYGFDMEEDGLLHYMMTAKDLSDRRHIITKTYLIIVSQGSSEKEILVNEDNGPTYGGAHIYLVEKNIFLVGGFKVKENKIYSYLYTFDNKGHVVNEKNILVEVDDEKRFVWKLIQGTDKVKLEFGSRGIIYSDGNAWVVGEQSGFKSGGDGTSNMHSGDHFYFYDIILAHFDLTNNTQSWTNFEKREHLKTRYVNGSPTNFLFTKNSNLEILYLDTQANIEKLKKGIYKPEDLENVIEHNSSTLVVGKIDKENKVTRQTSTSEFASAFHLKCRIVPNASGPTPNNYFCLRLTDSSFLVYLEDNNVGRFAIASNID